nr:alkane hydroxylase MAH1-like [Ipomoea batatas]
MSRRPSDLELGGEFQIDDVSCDPILGVGSENVYEFVVSGGDPLGSLPFGTANARIVAEIPKISRDISREPMKFMRCVEEQQAKAKNAFFIMWRLFPPIPMNHKMALETDILPSGHIVSPNTQILTSFYSMGRMEMEAIWDEDCMDFKHERWLSDSEGIKH